MFIKIAVQFVVFNSMFFTLLPSEELSIHEDEQNIVVTGSASFGSNSVTGKACIVMNSKQLKKVCKGDIVVAPAIHSTWYSALHCAAAIITEKGDDSSHAIALGKKLEIPIVVGASGATKNIIDGQTITCDPITRNIYHVAPPTPKEVHFDIVVTSKKDTASQSLVSKIEKVSNVYPLNGMSNQSNGTIIVSHTDSNGSSILEKENKPLRITTDVYRSHFDRFKKFVLKTKSKFEWGKFFGAIESGARLTGRNDFTIDCIPIGERFLESSERHIVDVLKHIETDRYIRYIDMLVEKCSKKPGDINWVARVSHEEHVKSIEIPADIKKEKLIEDPKEYKKIESKIDNAEKENLIASGLFALYWIEEGLPL